MDLTEKTNLEKKRFNFKFIFNIWGERGGGGRKRKKEQGVNLSRVR